MYVFSKMNKNTQLLKHNFLKILLFFTSNSYILEITEISIEYLNLTAAIDLFGGLRIKVS